jgi:hypothetical protein
MLDDLRRNVGQTLTDVAGRVVEQGQNLGNQAQLQLALKKLQVEQAKRIHELGKRTYEWYQTGTLVVTGHVPADITQLCVQLDDLRRQTEETQSKLDEARAMAQMSNPPAGVTPSVTSTTTTNPPDTTTPPAGPPPAALPPGTPPTSAHSTSKLD